MCTFYIISCYLPLYAHLCHLTIAYVNSLYTELNQNSALVQIINMSVGFFGIQFGWDLQRANMGRIYENLGANPDQIPLLFLAAPLTGLLVQPIIGYMSDRTWHPKWGRRRPYFMIGAILSSIALIFMPHSSTLVHGGGFALGNGCFWKCFYGTIPCICNR